MYSPKFCDFRRLHCEYSEFTAQRMSFDSMTSPLKRLDAIDSAKGIGILLVVFGHAWRGVRGSGLVPDDTLFRVVDFAVYAFHMPLFFFLSGLLFLEALQKHSTKNLLSGRLTRLLWPMALWSWMFFGLKLAAGEAANNPVAAVDFPIVPLPPYEHLWFLWALFLCQTFLILGYAMGGERLPATILRWGCAGVALVWAVLNPYIPVPSLIWGPMFEHFPYFLAGVAMGGILAFRPPVWAGVLCAVGFAVSLWGVQGEKAAVLHSLALLLLAWGAWLCVDRGTGANGVIRALRMLGQASMVIYLTHTVFSAALRIGLLKFGVDHVGVILCATLAIGIVVPVGVGLAARRLRLTKLLGF